MTVIICKSISSNKILKLSFVSSYEHNKFLEGYYLSRLFGYNISDINKRIVQLICKGKETLQINFTEGTSKDLFCHGINTGRDFEIIETVKEKSMVEVNEILEGKKDS